MAPLLPAICSLLPLSGVRHLFNANESIANQRMRITFGSSLTLALELLLAADILATAIAPTWDEIGKLAAIATLRTALNYFLERELKNTAISEPVVEKADDES